MGAGIALDNAAIMSTVLEGILYGFSFLLFMGTIWVLVQEEGYNTSRRAMIVIAVIFLVLSTAHMVVDIVRLDEGLVKYANTFPGGPNAFFGDVSQNTFVIKNAIYTLQTLLGDGVIYRCYIVWKSIWIIILPAVLWCSVAVTAIGSVYSVSQATVNATNIFASETGQWITAFFASTLSTNLLSTGLLAYRIWTIKSNVASIHTSKHTMMHILRVLLDSAALVSAALFTNLLCFVTSNNGQYVILDLIMPIISIAFYMVLVRIAVRRKRLSYVSNMWSTNRWSAAVEPRSARPLQVHISRYSKTDATLPFPLEGNHASERDQPSPMDKVRSDEAASQV